MKTFFRLTDDVVRMFMCLVFLYQITIIVAAQSPQVKILPLGDSITRGTNDINYPNGSIPGGFRKELGNRLALGGYTYDFVGSSTQNAAAGMDPDHEGHDGLRTDEILANLPTSLAASPDAVLLLAGTNDIVQDRSVSTAAANLGSIIDAITATAPNRRLYVATIIPITQAWPPQNPIYSAAYLNGKVDAFNVQVRNLVTQYANLGRKVYLVEMNGSIVRTNPNPALNFYQTGDGIHPGQAGYDQMGTIWYNSITSLGSLFTPPPPGSPQAPTNLAATVISSNRINVSWQDNSNNETGFSIFRKTGSGGTWQQVASVGSNARILSMTGLQTGANSYYFAVRASNASGDSAWSNIAASIPANVALNKSTSASTYYNEVYVASKANNGSINDLWATLSGDMNARWGVDLATANRLTHLQIVTRQDVDQPMARQNFEVRGSNDPAFSSYTVLANQGGSPLAHASTLAVDINSITPFRYVRITKTDGDYFSIAEVRLFGALPPAVPAAPGNLAITQTSGNQIALGWTDNSTSEIAFKLERKTGVSGTYAEIASIPANATHHTDTGLTPSNNYIYRLRATNGVDDSAYSGETTATIAPPTGYESWAAGYPAFLALPPADQAAGADPNNDGIVNLMACALGLNPLATPPPGSHPVVGTQPAPFFQFRRNTTSGLIYQVLVSDDLSPTGWQIQSQSGATIESLPGELGVENVSVPLGPGGGAKFARLRVIQN